MKSGIGIVLIIVALVLAYMGYQEFDQSRAAIEIGDLELSASDSDGKTTAYIYWGIGLIALLAGAALVKSKN